MSLLIAKKGSSEWIYIAGTYAEKDENYFYELKDFLPGIYGVYL